MIVITREQRRRLERDNAKQPRALQEVPLEEWPWRADMLARVWRSKSLLVQEYRCDPPALARLSVIRTLATADGWKAGISWDELQSIKNEVGYANHDAVEVFPRAADVVVNVNMRHLFVMAEPLSFAWRTA